MFYSLYKLTRVFEYYNWSSIYGYDLDSGLLSLVFCIYDICIIAGSWSDRVIMNNISLVFI